MSGPAGRSFAGMFVAVGFIFLSAVFFITASMLKTSSNTITRQQQLARYELAGQQVAFEKTPRQIRYEKLSRYCRTAGFGFLALGPLWVIGAAVLKEEPK